MFVYMIQPVVKPGCTTGLTTVLNEQTVRSNQLYNPVWQPVETLLTTGCIMYTNIYPVVKPVWQQVVSCKRGLTVSWRSLARLDCVCDRWCWGGDLSTFCQPQSQHRWLRFTQVRRHADHQTSDGVYRAAEYHPITAPRPFTAVLASTWPCLSDAQGSYFSPNLC